MLPRLALSIIIVCVAFMAEMYIHIQRLAYPEPLNGSNFQNWHTWQTTLIALNIFIPFISIIALLFIWLSKR